LLPAVSVRTLNGGLSVPPVKLVANQAAASGSLPIVSAAIDRGAMAMLAAATRATELGRMPCS